MLRNMLSLLLSKFYSKKDAALVAHQAIPELSQYIDLASSTTTNVENTYVAPTDGYFVCATKGGEGSGVNVWGTLDVGAPGAIGIQGKVFAPCAKGVSVHYIIYGTIHLVRFYKTIGGGYQALKNALLQGGAICLSNLCSSLRRSSLLAKRNGWRSSQPHPVLMFWLLRKRQMVDTEHLPSPHSTDFVLSDNTSGVRTLQILSAALRIKQIPLEWAQWLTLTILWEGFTALFRSRKETKSKVESFKGRLTNSLSLRPQGKPSSAVGGASC